MLVRTADRNKGRPFVVAANIRREKCLAMRIRFTASRRAMRTDPEDPRAHSCRALKVRLGRFPGELQEPGDVQSGHWRARAAAAVNSENIVFVIRHDKTIFIQRNSCGGVAGVRVSRGR